MSYRGKVLLLGDASVGKTSMLARYVDGIFKTEYIQTVGANFLIKELNVNDIIKGNQINPKSRKYLEGKGLSLYLWDISGQHDKLYVNTYFFEYAIGALVIFDISNRTSFMNIDYWIDNMKRLSGDVTFIIVGNKMDKKEDRQVTAEEAQKKAKNYHVKYIETSAKTNENINKIFEVLSIQIINKYLEK